MIYIYDVYAIYSLLGLTATYTASVEIRFTLHDLIIFTNKN